MTSAGLGAMMNNTFQVIPVLDLMGGRAVHAVAGRRAHYQPVRSILHASSDPLEIARSLHDVLGLRTLYLADLDAIAGGVTNVALFQEIISIGFHLIVDAGLRELSTSMPVLELDRAASTLVAGLETLRGPRVLRELLDERGEDGMIFSLDLFDGRPRIAAPAAWKSTDPRELAREAIANGVRQILLLDLARVGTSRGPGTQRLLAQIRCDHPAVRVSAGGGIARIEDVIELKDSGAWGVLVGSALHDGRIGPAELACVRANEPRFSTR
jgi:phosphoribosylformimino-5-aminoimidazole carboxamide ribotide isomerase